MPLVIKVFVVQHQIATRLCVCIIRCTISSQWGGHHYATCLTRISPKDWHQTFIQRKVYKYMMTGGPTAGTPTNHENGVPSPTPEWNSGRACTLLQHSKSIDCWRVLGYMHPSHRVEWSGSAHAPPLLNSNGGLRTPFSWSVASNIYHPPSAMTTICWLIHQLAQDDLNCNTIGLMNPKRMKVMIWWH